MNAPCDLSEIPLMFLHLSRREIFPVRRKSIASRIELLPVPLSPNDDSILTLKVVFEMPNPSYVIDFQIQYLHLILLATHSIPPSDRKCYPILEKLLNFKRQRFGKVLVTL